MSVKPLDDRVLIMPQEAETTTKGGIVLPDTAKEKPQRGTVVATGPGKLLEDGKRVALNVKAGDKVLYGKYSGTEIKIDGVEHKIMKESEIFGILTE
jgi:chaperonin GroES